MCINFLRPNKQTMNKLHTIAMGKLGIRRDKTFGFLAKWLKRFSLLKRFSVPFRGILPFAE